MSTRSEKVVPPMRFDKSQFNSLIKAIEELVKVFAFAQIRMEEGTDRKARFLRVFGLTEQEIADLLGVAQPTVHIALSKAKKKRKAAETTE